MAKENQVIGTCKLCRSVGPLRESHYMPKSAYKLIGRANEGAPVILKEKVAIQKDEQIKAYVLCQECEQRFSENGESWVMKFCHREGEGFKLKNLIEASKPLLGDDKLRVYSAANIAEIDIEKLAYYAASIILRGSVHKWKSGRYQLNGLFLGSKCGQEWRLCVWGRTRLICSTFLWLSDFTSCDFFFNDTATT